jgi:hypothetical protein
MGCARLKRQRARFALSISVLFVLSACAKSSVIPRSDYDTLSPDDEARYEIKTLDGKIYDVSSVTVARDALVGHGAQGSDGQEEDVTIPLAQVESVSRMSATGHAMAFVSGLAIVGVLAAVGYVVMVTATGVGY